MRSLFFFKCERKRVLTLRSPKICCFFGETEIPDSFIELATQKIDREIRLAIREGYKTFITCLDAGANLLFIQALLKLQEEKPILKLQIALPYTQQAEDSITRETVESILSKTVHLRAKFSSLDPEETIRERDRLVLERARKIILLGHSDNFVMKHGIFQAEDKQVSLISLSSSLPGADSPATDQ